MLANSMSFEEIIDDDFVDFLEKPGKLPKHRHVEDIEVPVEKVMVCLIQLIPKKTKELCELCMFITNNGTFDFMGSSTLSIFDFSLVVFRLTLSTRKFVQWNVGLRPSQTNSVRMMKHILAFWSSTLCVSYE